MGFFMNIFEKINANQRDAYDCPAIFVPGSSAGKNRFDLTFKKLGIKPSDVLKIVVNEDCSLELTGNYKGYVVISFKNNKDGAENIEEQAFYLDSAFAYLASQYDFQIFNAIGHSNGGLNWTLFLENYFAKYRKNIRNLITLGSPYNLENDIDNPHPLLSQMIADSGKLPADMNVYSFVGIDDGIVDVTSAQASFDVHASKVASYQQLNLEGLSSYHSAQPQNDEFIELLTKIL